MRNPDLLGSWIRRFLLEYLVGERNFAENTRRSYRDTLALAIPFVAAAAGTSVDRLLVSDVAADRIRQFLGHVEQARSSRITTRNQRWPRCIRSRALLEAEALSTSPGAVRSAASLQEGTTRGCVLSRETRDGGTARRAQHPDSSGLS
jgi:hypothetical protein